MLKGSIFNQVLKKLAANLLIIVTITMMVPMKINAETSADGVYNRINQLKEIYPDGSYFSANRLPCSHARRDTCSNCQLSNIIKINHPEFSGAGLRDAWTCCAFARFAYYYVFGLKTTKSMSESNSTQVALKDAKRGDFVVLNNNGHYGIFLYKSQGLYYLYEANVRTTNGVSYAAMGHEASVITTVWHPNNYESINYEYSSTNDNAALAPFPTWSVIGHQEYLQYDWQLRDKFKLK